MNTESYTFGASSRVRFAAAALVLLLEDTDDGPRSRALDALGRVAGGDAKRIAPLAAKGLVDPSWLVRTAAAEVREAAKEALEKILSE